VRCGDPSWKYVQPYVLVHHSWFHWRRNALGNRVNFPLSFENIPRLSIYVCAIRNRISKDTATVLMP
jgi:hypothetical protein